MIEENGCRHRGNECDEIYKGITARSQDGDMKENESNKNKIKLFLYCIGGVIPYFIGI
jgi:hypothetical protein